MIFHENCFRTDFVVKSVSLICLLALQYGDSADSYLACIAPNCGSGGKSTENLEKYHYIMRYYSTTSKTTGVGKIFT